MTDTTQKDWLLPASILTAAILISGSIIYLVKSGGTVQPAAPAGNNQAAGAQGAAPAGLADLLKAQDRDVVMGDPNAPVTLVEYADFQCPFCGRFFTGAESQIRSTYVKSGKVKMIYRDLAFLGPESTASAEAAECAKDQGKFWQYHDALYNAEIADGQENNGNLNRALFLKLADNVGISDTRAFTSCIDTKKYESVVQKIVTDAQAVQINSTPTLFVGTQQIAGAQPFTVFQAAIDKALGGK